MLNVFFNYELIVLTLLNLLFFTIKILFYTLICRKYLEIIFALIRSRNDIINSIL